MFVSEEKWIKFGLIIMPIVSLLCFKDAIKGFIVADYWTVFWNMVIFFCNIYFINRDMRRLKLKK